MLEVIASVKADEPSAISPSRSGRPAGDPAALVADVTRIRATLDWRPQFQDLDTIVSHAFAWEQLAAKRKTAAA